MTLFLYSSFETEHKLVQYVKQETYVSLTVDCNTCFLEVVTGVCFTCFHLYMFLSLHVLHVFIFTCFTCFHLLHVFIQCDTCHFFVAICEIHSQFLSCFKVNPTPHIFQSRPVLCLVML